jgi:hypothetical protein
LSTKHVKTRDGATRAQLRVLEWALIVISIRGQPYEHVRTSTSKAYVAAKPDYDKKRMLCTVSWSNTHTKADKLEDYGIYADSEPADTYDLSVM